MIPKLQINRVEDILELLEVAMSGMPATQSIDWLSEHIGALCGYLAFTNAQMAAANRELNIAKERAYAEVVLSHLGIGPSIIKSFAASKCAEQQYNYDICERAARCIVHQLDALRSVLSALKEEMKISSYQGQI